VSNECDRKASTILLPLALQPTVGFGLLNNISPFVPIYHQLSPSSHSQHFKISFRFFSPSFPGFSSSSRPFQFLSEDLFGNPIILHSLQVTQATYPLSLYPFYYIFLIDVLYNPILVAQASTIRGPKFTRGCRAIRKNPNILIYN